MRALLGRPQQDYYNYLVQSLHLLSVQGDAACRVGAIASPIMSMSHRFTYDSAMGVKAITQSICDLALGFGEGEKKKMRVLGGWLP